jgi:hypothetical protein
MTSNAEEQATTQPVAPAQPPKAARAAHVAPRKPRVAASKPKSGKKASPADGRAQSQKGAMGKVTRVTREGVCCRLICRPCR